MKKTPIFSSFSFPTLIIFLLSISPFQSISASETLEIGIGGGGGFTIGGSPPPAENNCPPPPPRASQYESERIALIAPIIKKFKTKVTCDPKGILNSWKGNDICNYQGLNCAMNPKYKQKALAGIQFNGAGFAGPDLCLDGFLDKLPDLSIFHANSNNFTGVIPAGIAELPYLFELDFSNNKHSGDFPNAVLQATQLTFLDLRFNQFSGRVPPEVFLLRVDAFFVNNNNFVQTIPSNLGQIPSLFLSFANNKFTGQIPTSIKFAQKNLLEILFLNNQLSGCLPYEIGYLKNARVFDVQKNYLTGPIPYSFGCLESTRLLILAQNEFYGEVPEVVCKLPRLSNLTLTDNYFSWVGPACRRLIEKRVLDVRGNCIVGLPAQKSAAQCHEFFAKPKYCPELKWAKYMPCKENWYLKEESGLDEVMGHGEFDAPPLTYGALSPSH